MIKLVYLGLSILELSKIAMQEFSCDYIKPKYCEKAKLCQMDTESFIVHVKTDDIYKDIAEDAETRFDTSNYQLNRPLKKVIGLMKEELGGKIMTKFVELRAKTFSYLIDDSREDKKQKTQRSVS